MLASADRCVWSTLCALPPPLPPPPLFSLCTFTTASLVRELWPVSHCIPRPTLTVTSRQCSSSAHQSLGDNNTQVYRGFPQPSNDDNWNGGGWPHHVLLTTRNCCQILRTIYKGSGLNHLWDFFGGKLGKKKNFCKRMIRMVGFGDCIWHRILYREGGV